MGKVWAIYRCRRCGRPLVAELVASEKARYSRIYKTYEEAEKKAPLARMVFVEEFPTNLPLDDDPRYQLDDLKFFKNGQCPVYPGKFCED
ncbi:hypothetical protein GG496_000973 [Candidatus Fervidibacteria bacterium JGI MDM2 JNZ-1-D12]